MPCPPDSERDALLASDLNAASHDEARAGELLAKAFGDSDPARTQLPLWPTDWLVLAFRDEARGDFPSAAARYRKYEASLEGSGEDTRWVEPRVKVLELAAGSAAGTSTTSTTFKAFVAEPEARLALADGRAALARGDKNAAREKLGYALRLDPRYADAAVAAAALDAQTGRAADAIREYRAALAADPERDDAAVPLANLLWEHPDRASKAESLLLLDRAAAARPDLPSLGRRSAERWAEWGDPTAALQRLDAWRAVVSEAERKQTDALRAELAGRAATASRSSSSSASADPPAVSPRPRLDLPAAHADAGAAPGVGAWIWGAAAAALAMIAGAVLARRRRSAVVEAVMESEPEPAPAEPPAPVPPITTVGLEDLVRFLRSAAEERQLAPPPLSSRGFPEEGQPPWVVRLPPPDWERLWRTVFGATLSAFPAVRAGGGSAPRLAISGSLARDPATHAVAVRFALADNAPGTLTTEMIRGRSAGKDWAAVEDLVRAHRGSIAVAPSIDRQFARRLLIELPVEPGAPMPTPTPGTIPSA